ncbi:MAG TPA: recombination protein RecR [Candidatus Jorgensenbacteria bacterium]|nr:recombination protein RecR [Candidatus Jorgensenbacteria bacterium]
MRLPNAIEKFVELFSQLPSIGPRMARRLAFYFISTDKQTFTSLTQALSQLQTLDRCPRCFFIKETEQTYCSICADPKRDKATVAIVEKETSVLSIEQMGKFRGTYLILGNLKNGQLQKSQQRRLQRLKQIATEELGGAFKECIIATNPTTEGDVLAHIIKQELGTHAQRITRLGRGMPTGGDVEFADEETLGSAFEGRQ